MTLGPQKAGKGATRGGNALLIAQHKISSLTALRPDVFLIEEGWLETHPAATHYSLIS